MPSCRKIQVFTAETVFSYEVFGELDDSSFSEYDSYYSSEGSESENGMEITDLEQHIKQDSQQLES